MLDQVMDRLKAAPFGRSSSAAAILLLRVLWLGLLRNILGSNAVPHICAASSETQRLSEAAGWSQVSRPRQAQRYLAFTTAERHNRGLSPVRNALGGALGTPAACV